MKVAQKAADVEAKEVVRPRPDPRVLALAEALAALLVPPPSADELVDVLAYVPGPRRPTMRACRDGAIEGASRVGRRWLARRTAVDAWLRTLGPRLVSEPSADDDGDELEDLRRSISRDSTSKRKAGRKS